MRWQVPLAVRCKTIDQGKGHESASEYRKDFLDELWHAAPSTLHVHQRAKAGVQEIFIGTLDRRSLDECLFPIWRVILVIWHFVCQPHLVVGEISSRASQHFTD